MAFQSEPPWRGSAERDDFERYLSKRWKEPLLHAWEAMCKFQNAAKRDADALSLFQEAVSVADMFLQVRGYGCWFCLHFERSSNN